MFNFLQNKEVYKITLLQFHFRPCLAHCQLFYKSLPSNYEAITKMKIQSLKFFPLGEDFPI
jgi:hypothetical protein